MPGPSIDEVNNTLPASKKPRIAHAHSQWTQQPYTQQPLQQSQQQPAQQPLPRSLQQHPKDPPKKKVRTKSAPNKNSSVSVQPKVPDSIKSKNEPENRSTNCPTQQPLPPSQQQPAQQPPLRLLQQHPKEFPREIVRPKSAPNKNSSVSLQPKVPDSIKSLNKQDNRGSCSTQQPLQQSQQQPAQHPPPQPLQQHQKELPKKEVHTMSAPNKNTEDHLKKYVEILTDEQRTRYNKDYNAEYDEYKMLSEKSSDRTKIFRDLNAKMKSTDDVDVYEVRVA